MKMFRNPLRDEKSLTEQQEGKVTFLIKAHKTLPY